MLQAFLLGGTPGVAQHASFGEEALRQRHARLHAALDSTFGRCGQLLTPSPHRVLKRT